MNGHHGWPFAIKINHIGFYRHDMVTKRVKKMVPTL